MVVWFLKFWLRHDERLREEIRAEFAGKPHLLRKHPRYQQVSKQIEFAEKILEEIEVRKLLNSANAHITGRKTLS